MTSCLLARWTRKQLQAWLCAGGGAPAAIAAGVAEIDRCDAEQDGPG